MKSQYYVFAGLISLTLLSAHGDVLELKNGKVLNGKYVGGTAGTVRFETGDGVQVIEAGQALALTFSGGSSTAAAPAPATAAVPAPVVAPASSSVAVPAGTTLLVRMVDSVSSRDAQGKRFTTTLENDLAVNGTVVLKAGTKIYGRVQGVQQARRYTGQSTLDLRLAEIAVGPSLVPITTTGYTDAGARSVGKAAR